MLDDYEAQQQSITKKELAAIKEIYHLACEVHIDVTNCNNLQVKYVSQKFFTTLVNFI